jgi:transposase
VAETYASGETVSAVARRHGLTPQQLFGWRRAGRRQAEDEGIGNPAFTPVVVEAAAPGAAVPIASRPAAIEIVVGVVTVRIPPEIDAATLQDRLKIVAWDGSGLVLFWKRPEHGAFRCRRSATA